jgi:multidrug efflux pump subunit AcrA (membrane-fusion protein)
VSDKNMDDLLAQLKAEFEPKPQLKSQSKSKANQPSASSKSKSPPPQTSASQVPINQMLGELRKELESGRGRANHTPSTSPQSPTSAQPRLSAKDAAQARQRLNALIDQDYQAQAQKREAKLAEIKRQAEAKLAEEKHQAEVKLAEEKRRQQELIELQQRQELRDRRRQEALREEAKTWLLKLNPRSEEGKWFQEFSYSYENKLQAAIDYLEAMQETGL